MGQEKLLQFFDQEGQPGPQIPISPVEPPSEEEPPPEE